MSTRMICETCAAELKLAEDKLSGKCPYCRNTYYFKEEKGEALILALNRARGHRLACDFHEAIKEYKLVLDKFPSDAEAHYGMLLSTYGIEYVQDRRTNRWIPTCHRFVDKDIFKNQNYIAAIANAAEGQRAVYTAEAGTIASLQSRIKAQLDSEAPYDVFISFKSTDEDGRPTEDSVIARNIYDALTKRGIKTFFSEVTLKNRIGDEYEPIIYRALYSCKFFILVTTREDYLNSPWVKNEWTRFEDRIAEEGLSAACTSVFRGISPYILPRAFQNQGIDLEKHPFDYAILLADNLAVKLGLDERSDEKDELSRKLEEQEKRTREMEDMMRNLAATSAGSKGGSSARTADVEPLLKRAAIFLGDHDWVNADAKCEAVLDIDPENGRAYIYKMMAQLRISSEDKLKLSPTPLENTAAYKNAVRYSDEKTSEMLISYNEQIKDKLAQIQAERNEAERIEREKKAREEQLRRERKAVEDKRRAERNQLEVAKGNITSLIQSQIAEKSRIESSIEKNERTIHNFGTHKKKLVSRAWSVMIFGIIELISFIIAVTAIEGGSDDALVLPLLALIASIIGVLVQTVRLALLRGEGGAVITGVITYFTGGVYGVIYAVNSMRACKLNITAADNEKLRAQLLELDAKIDISRKSLKEINGKLEAYK